MQFKVNPKIFEQYPQLRLGIVLIHDIHNNSSTPSIRDFVQKTEKLILSHVTAESVKSHPYITEWHSVYKNFGAKPKEHLVSVENLLSRLCKTGGSTKSTNALVDLYNIFSMKYMVPVGGEDLDTIKGDLELTYASDHEAPVLLLGDKEPRVPSVGEIFYKDANGAVCRRWNWREADRTKITEQTKNALLVFEALSVVGQDVIENALYECAHVIQNHCGGIVTIGWLDKENQSISLQEQGRYVHFNKPEEPKKSLDLSVTYALKHAHAAAAENKTSVEQEARAKKVEALRAQGIEPWLPAQSVANSCHQVIEEQAVSQDEREYVISGRLMTIRGHGKTSFCNLQDSSGKLQIYIKEDLIGSDKFEFFQKYIDLGDLVWCKGTAFLTKTGELTLRLNDFKLLAKCLHPLPEKFHGLSDIEIKHRQRYLDLLISSETRERFMKRSCIIQTIREYLNSYGYLEVETPMLHPIPGGAAARPFITHHNALDTDFYLRIAPELYLKRLLVGGFERVYEINRNFRNEGVSTRHNPEFTMIEFYTAHHDYHYIMNFVETLFKKLAMDICGTLQIPFGSHVINFDNFRRVSPYNAVIEYGGLTKEALAPERIDITCKEKNVAVTPETSYNQKIFALFEACAESKLIDPVFIVDFPIEISPLAQRDAKDPAIAARFELFIAGMEFGNGFNELNDPFDQAERFKKQVEAHAAGDEEAMHYDADFITALEYGMPPAVGVGIGIDRLVMLLSNTVTIKEVILFPALKRK